MKIASKYINTQPLKLLAILSAALMLSVAHAKVYKWTDKDGNVHYTSKPPQNLKSKNMEQDLKLSLGKRPTQAVSSKDETDEEDEAEDKTSKETASKEQQSQFVKICKQKRSQLDIMQNNDQIRWNENGKSVLLSAEERAKKIATIESEVTKFCSEEA